MWQLFVFFFGFVFCSDNITHVETLAEEDVNLQCPGTIKTDGILTITWKSSNGDILFNCDRFGTPCETNTTTYTLGSNNDTFISTVTIRNVSLVHEDEYSFLMVSKEYRETCKINLTVTVPPKSLILVEKADDTILQEQGSLMVAEGEQKTLVCKTNSSVKPSIDLEWDYPDMLNASVEPQQNMYDGHDERLLVPTRTIHFTPTYADGNDIVLICEVASNSTHDHIQTSVIIKKEGECTTNHESPETGSKKSHAVTTSNRDLEVSGTSYTTPFDPSIQDKPWYKQIRLVMPVFSGLVMMLIVLAFVGGFIRSKRRNVRHSTNVESTEIRPLQGRRSLPPTPSDHLPDQPPPTARILRPVPSIPSDNPMRPLVPVSEDTIRSPAERTGSRMPGETFTTTDGRTLVTQAQKELDTEMDYDLLNISHHGAPGAVPHVYRETTNGLAEYALVSRQQVDKRIDQRQRHRSKQMEDDSDYDLLNTWNQAEHGTVPHVYKETTSGLAEYAVVSKPDDKKKRQSLGPLTKVMKAPINVEAEYAVVDKSKKRAK